MDDIVTRLEAEHWCDADDCNLAQLAADEIERLRAEVNNASAMANAYYELVQAYKWSHAHLGEWPEAIANLLAENYTLKKAANNGL